jgi:hypothetical protein
VGQGTRAMSRCTAGSPSFWPASGLSTVPLASPKSTNSGIRVAPDVIVIEAGAKQPSVDALVEKGLCQRKILHDGRPLASLVDLLQGADGTRLVFAQSTHASSVCSVCSVCSVAIRVSSRTAHQDSSPEASAVSRRGKTTSARPTRSRSSVCRAFTPRQRSAYSRRLA